mgnify:CR=1 FL=1
MTGVIAAFAAIAVYAGYDRHVISFDVVNAVVRLVLSLVQALL